MMARKNTNEEKVISVREFELSIDKDQLINVLKAFDLVKPISTDNENANTTTDNIFEEFGIDSKKIPTIQEPMHSQQQLQALEQTFCINTKDVMNHHVIISKNLLDKWQQCYDDFLIFDGDESNINTIKTNKEINHANNFNQRTKKFDSRCKKSLSKFN